MASDPTDTPLAASRRGSWQQTLVGAGTIAVAAGIAWGAVDIPSQAGYGGVGANFLPWVVAAALALCGVLLVREALTGGFRQMEQAPGERPNWMAFVWVSAALLLNWALIEHLGFLISCALAYVLAVQGLRRAYGKPHDTWLADSACGVLLSAPVYWFFTQFLAIGLPGLTRSGWI